MTDDDPLCIEYRLTPEVKQRFRNAEHFNRAIMAAPAIYLALTELVRAMERDVAADRLQDETPALAFARGVLRGINDEPPKDTIQ